MIEVFKTDVKDRDHARLLVDQIHKTFQYCHANFDLDDCDKILRVTGIRSEAEVDRIISIVKSLGSDAQILPDDPSFDEQLFTHETEWGNG